MKTFHIGSGPFVKSKNKTNQIMMHLLIALFPIIIFATVKNGYIPYKHGYINFISIFYPLLFILIGAVTTFFTELIYTRLALRKEGSDLKNSILNSYSFFPGLFLSLILPINTPILILIVGGIIATIIGKMLFGGFGNNVFNPALIGALFILTIYSVAIVNNGGYMNKYELDTITSSTPLSNVIEGSVSYENTIEPYGTLTNFMVGTIPGAIGETSAILIVLAFIYLSFFKVIKWKIPFFYISTVFIMTYLIGGLNDLGIWYPIFQITSGGLLFGAVFMATDPVTSPTTPIGQVIYGFFLGILTVVFRYMTPYPEGVLTSILTMNMFVFMIDKIGMKSRFNFSKSLIVFVVIWFLIISFSVNIADSLNSSNVDNNFQIIEKNVNENETKYIVSQKGFAGNIKASIIFKDDIIVSIEVLEQNESYYKKITDENYIQKLINSQDNINDLDTISGATVSSTALKNLVSNVLKDYKG